MCKKVNKELEEKPMWYEREDALLFSVKICTCHKQCDECAANVTKKPQPEKLGMKD